MNPATKPWLAETQEPFTGSGSQFPPTTSRTSRKVLRLSISVTRGMLLQTKTEAGPNSELSFQDLNLKIFRSVDLRAEPTNSVMGAKCLVRKRCKRRLRMSSLPQPSSHWPSKRFFCSEQNND